MPHSLSVASAPVDPSLAARRIGESSVGVPKWILATALAAFGVVLSSGTMPWRQALAGAFVPPDFAADIAGARAVAAGGHPYTPAFATEHARVMAVAPVEGYPYFPHPPTAVLLFRPLASLGLGTAALLWFAVSVCLLFCLARVLAEAALGTHQDHEQTRVSPLATTYAFGALLAWPPVLYNLEKGQLSILLAVLVAVVWRSLEHKRLSLAGTCLGVATALKVFPLVLGGYLLVRARRAVIYLVVTAGLLTGGALMWMGVDALRPYLQHSSDNLSYWQTWPAVSYSLYGAVARALVGGAWAEPIVHAPLVARGVIAGISIVLIGCATIMSWPGPSHDGRDRCRFAAWATLLVLLNPLAMGHNGVLLALPIVLIARALATDGRTWPKLAWSVGVLLASFPRQTLVSVASPPIEPSLSLTVIALPMWGTLLLFWVALALVRASHVAPRSSLDSLLAAR